MFSFPASTSTRPWNTNTHGHGGTSCLQTYSGFGKWDEEWDFPCVCLERSQHVTQRGFMVKFNVFVCSWCWKQMLCSQTCAEVGNVTTELYHVTLLIGVELWLVSGLVSVRVSTFPEGNVSTWNWKNKIWKFTNQNLKVKICLINVYKNMNLTLLLYFLLHKGLLISNISFF